LIADKTSYTEDFMLSLNIQWSEPKKWGNKWKRECVIPSHYLSGFFTFWKKNRFKLLADGFSISKSEHSGKWYLHETKENIALFKNFSEEPHKSTPEDNFILPDYKIKDTSGLRSWQVDPVGKLVSSVKHWNAAINGSDLGVGKTYMSCAVARELDYNLVVVCPKAVIKSWNRVIRKHFNMGDKLLGVVNYEKLKTGKKDSEIASYVLSRTSKRNIFTWKIPKKTLIVWDESQKLKNWKTKNAKMCAQAIKEGYPMLFCSATNATNPLEMRVVGLALKMFKGGNKDYYQWARAHGVYDGNWGLEFNNDPSVLKKLHKDIFDKRGVRLRRDTIPNFPDSEVISEVYNMDEEDAKRINQIHKEMEAELNRLEKIKKGDGESELIIQLRARQQIELIKVPLFVEMVEDAIEQGFSVVVFINFTETLNALSARLNTKCIFDGKTSDKVRDQNVEDFQDDKERVILVNVQSGGAGLDLHDLHGNFPRMSLISPSYSPVYMRQALGRIWRDDAKTKSIQKIVCVANTVEETVCRNVQLKLDNLDMLNDGDLLYSADYTVID
jgi:superfamily II DNA or RNA helicase